MTCLLLVVGWMDAWCQQPFDLDTSFRVPVVTSPGSRGASSVLALEDGSLIAGGAFKLTGDTVLTRNGVRLNAAGSPDPQFELQPRMGSDLTRWNDRFYTIDYFKLRRLWLNGAEDTTFAADSSEFYEWGVVYDYAVLPDSGLLTVGYFELSDTVHGFTGFYGLAWRNADGTLDTTATHRGQGASLLRRIVQLSNGKFICASYLSAFDGHPVSSLFRLHSDGSLDTTFYSNLPGGGIDQLTELPDGRIIVTGFYTLAGSSDTLNIARLLPDGALDSTFNYQLDVVGADIPGFGAWHHTVLPDGRIALHGDFVEVDGETRHGIALISANGVLLPDVFSGDGCGTYANGTVSNAATNGMVQDPIGNWYIYGSYVGYDDGTTNDPQQRFVSRLYGLNVGVEEVDQPLQLQVYPNPTSGRVQVQLPEGAQGATLQVLDAQGQVLRTERMLSNAHVLDLPGAAAGVYAVRVRTAQGRSGRATVVVQP
ncbi:MAG: T9SS type A sorting domain-containing protein [Flavobacteriales bacterium]|nr:T9SS type A sorting domain-containing protein [Flavobacteriales bacterium]